MSDPLELSFEDDRPTWRPDDLLVVRGEGFGLRVKDCIARLVWFTEGRGDEDFGIAAEQRLGDDPSLKASFRLPAGPWTYDGLLVKIRWAAQLEVVTVEGRKLEGERGFRLHPRDAEGADDAAASDDPDDDAGA